MAQKYHLPAFILPGLGKGNASHQVACADLGGGIGADE